MSRRDRLIRRELRQRFVITLTTGETFEGLLDRVDESTVVLLDAYTMAVNGSKTGVDGALFLPRDHVAYMQQP